MNETQSITRLYQDLFDGDPWLDVNLLGTLQAVSAEKASKRIPPIPNSIWEIVNHMIEWRLNVLQRVKGQVLESPEDNYFRAVSDKSQAAWEETIECLKDSQSQWLSFLNDINPDTFSKIYPGNGMSNFQHIHGIIQHDAYHLGQIVLLAKYA